MRNVLAGHCRRMALTDDLSLNDVLDILKFIPYNYVIPYNYLECHVTYSYVYINNVCVYIYRSTAAQRSFFFDAVARLFKCQG